jgi:hypothetical protein
VPVFGAFKDVTRYPLNPAEPKFIVAVLNVIILVSERSMSAPDNCIVEAIGMVPKPEPSKTVPFFKYIVLPVNVNPAAQIPVINDCNPVNVCAAFVTAIFVIVPVTPFTEETPVTAPVSPLNDIT